MNIIRRKFTVLTRKDLVFTQGKEEKLFKTLRNKLGKTDEEILRIIIDS
jgi:hypothetical protein